MFLPKLLNIFFKRLLNIWNKNVSTKSCVDTAVKMQKKHPQKIIENRSLEIYIINM